MPHADQLPRTHANMYGAARHPAMYERIARVLAMPLYRRVAADVAQAGLPPEAVVLDIGTGPGRVARMIAATNPDLRVMGVDLSEEMIDFAAAARPPRAGEDCGSLDFQIADVVDLPFPDASVDLVISSLSLHHWADVMAGLAEIVRVLKPGAAAWLYDMRAALASARPGDGTLATKITVESPLTRTLRINPVGRLVMMKSGKVA